MVESRNPSRAAAAARGREPPLNWTTSRKLRHRSATNSGGPILTAISASAGAMSVMPRTPSVPAMNEPQAQMASAGPALPCRAIW